MINQQGRCLIKIDTLYDRDISPNGLLTPELQRLYDGNLAFPAYPSDRPYVISNFVETLDGVVSYKIPGQSGGDPISGGSAEDHFLMGLLRAASDAVLIGSGTFRDTSSNVRPPLAIYPEAKPLYAKLREKLGKSPAPLKVILTASGNLNLDDPTFHSKKVSVVVITSNTGAARLASASADKFTTALVRSTGEADTTTPAEVLRILFKEFGVRLLLHEGGPEIFGQFLKANLIDTQFLTIAPQLVGRGEAGQRPSFVGSEYFMPETAPWMKLMSLKKSTNHLFLRYEKASQKISNRS